MRKWVLLWIFLYAGNLLAQEAGCFDKGKQCQEMGLYEEAIEWYSKVKPINLIQKRKLYEPLAQCYKLAGNYTQAIRWNERLLELVRGENLEKVLLNLSGLWLLTGEYQKVIDALEEKTFSVGEEIKIINLSSAYMRLNNPEKALALLDDVLETSLADTSVYRSAIQNKGYILWVENRFAEAESALSTAYAMYSDEKSDKYVCAGNLAVVEAELQDFDKALLYIGQALEWQKVHLGKSHPDYLVSLRKKAEILLKKGNISESVSWFKKYFEGEKDYVLANFAFMTEDERLNFWNVHNRLLSECYATATADPDFLFDVAVFSKSVLMQANINFQKLVAANPRMLADYTRLKKLRMQLRSAKIPDRILLEKEAERLELHLIAEVSEFEAYRKDLTVGLKDIKVALKNNSDRLVEFVQYIHQDSIRYAALVAGKAVSTQFIPLFSAGEFERLELQANGRKSCTVKEAIYSRRNEDKNRLYSDTLLGRKIWEPILKHVPSQSSVYFVPEGLFYLLGIEYMVFDRPDCRFYRLSSSRRLCEKHQKVTSWSPLLVGGLDYDDKSSVKEYVDTIPDRRGSKVLYIDRLPPVVGGRYTYLTGSRMEIDSIGHYWQGGSCRILSRSQGTERNIKHEIQTHNLVHLSTHGYCSDYQIVPQLLYAKDSISEDLSMLRCGVVLSGANLCAKQKPENEKVEDGVLTARELCDLNLHKVDLFVLSACQTGLGRVTVDGMSGMPRGLKKGGANSVMVSLWEVNDKATQYLMSFFYENLIKKKMPKCQALQSAQEKMRTSVIEQPVVHRLQPIPPGRAGMTVQVDKISFSQPCYWASFILIDGI